MTHFNSLFIINLFFFYFIVAKYSYESMLFYLLFIIFIFVFLNFLLKKQANKIIYSHFVVTFIFLSNHLGFLNLQNNYLKIVFFIKTFLSKYLK